MKKNDVLYCYHYRVVVSARHFAEYAHQNDPIIYYGNCKTYQECLDRITTTISYPAIKINIWYDPYNNISEETVYPIHYFKG